MPSENAGIPQFFETVEKLFLMYEVPDDVKSKLLLPVLTAQAKTLVNCMSVESMGTYAELKRFLLAEYKLIPHDFKEYVLTLPLKALTRHMCCLLPGCVICVSAIWSVRMWGMILTSCTI